MNYDYPKEIQVGGHKFKVELVDGLYVNSTANHTADCLIAGGSISIATRLADGGYKTIEEINSSLLHEIIETINIIYVADLGDGESKESRVEALSQGLLQVLSQLGVYLIKDGR